MNRTLKIILIVIWSIIAIGFTVLFVYSINNRDEAYGMFSSFDDSINSECTVQKDENIDINGTNKIDVSFSSSNIIIITTDEPNIRIVQKSSKTLTDDEKFQSIKSNNEITIKKGNLKEFFNIFNFGSKQEVIELYIPKNYNGDLNIDTASGDIEFNSDIELSNANFETSSGNIVLENSIKTKDINLETSSGNISLGTLITNRYNMESSSGNIKVNSLTGSGDIDTASGNIKVQYKDISDYSKVSASSGDIDLFIQDGLSFEFSGECSSGRISSNYDLSYKGKKHNEATAKIGNGPYIKIDASTSSGDIEINN